MGQKVAHRVHELDARLVVLDGDVHVQAEHQVGAGHHLEVVNDLLVARGVRDRDLGPVRERMRAGRRDPDAVLAAQPDDLRAQPGHLLARLADVPADRGSHLDHRLVHLALDQVLQARLAAREQLLDVRPQLPGFGVDDLELLLDAERKRRPVGHR